MICGGGLFSLLEPYNWDIDRFRWSLVPQTGAQPQLLSPTLFLPHSLSPTISLTMQVQTGKCYRETEKKMGRNEEALFYLQSRGIGLEKAKGLLIYAFAGEVLETISIPSLKDTLEKILTEKLGTEL